MNFCDHTSGKANSWYHQRYKCIRYVIIISFVTSLHPEMNKTSVCYVTSYHLNYINSKYLNKQNSGNKISKCSL